MVKTALLIGVSEYAAGLNPLPKAVDDIAAMKTVLEKPELGGFTEVKVLPNPEPFEMQFEIEQLFAGRKKDDLIVLFFSGHGVKDDSGNLYFATSLTKKTSEGELIKSTAVPSRFIHDIMSNSRSRRQVVILDCCFSGAFAKGLSAKDDGSVPVKEQLGGEGRVVLTSSTATQYSFEESGEDLSVYTRYLVEGITSGAADIDNDGMIGVEELHEYAKLKVHESSPAMKPKIYAVEEGFKILLTQSPVHDPKLMYRKEVEERTSQGQISAVGRRILDALKVELGLSDEVAAEIEEAAVKPHKEYQAKLSTYQQVLKETLEKESPLSAYARDELRRYQKVLGLRDQDVAPIKTQILGSPRPQSGPPNRESLQNEATNSAPIKAQFFSQPPNEIQEGTPVGQASKTPLSGSHPTSQPVASPVSATLESMPASGSAEGTTTSTSAPNTLLGPPPQKRRANLSWLFASALAISLAAAGGGFYKWATNDPGETSGPTTPSTIITPDSGTSDYKKPPE
ncbi:MAG: caspase family protein, partial [Cyanobacteria bacterium P01_F01_bin.53]